MNKFLALTKRNIKLFFKDKGMFFASLITPIILLVLYATFLSRVYKESFLSGFPESMPVDDKLVNGFVGGELLSALLAVCCITVAFSSNMIMVQDKAKGSIHDFLIAPVDKSTLALSYYVATLVSTLLICFIALVLGMIYLACVGWYMSAGDVFLVILDVILLSLFGTALSSIINNFLSSQGQMSAVGTIVSAGYGFICGAYMPISQYGKGLQNFLSFLPGTYGTSLIRNHSLNGVYRELTDMGVPSDILDKIKDSLDCNIYFFDNKVSVGGMFWILIISILVLVAIFILLNIKFKKRKKQTK
ncbi:MAG: ABC transporter permease [Clostridiales bacterium]|nr:ABC transporter permease [Clostridiales bacterium]